jgi:hypothetical protein
MTEPAIKAIGPASSGVALEVQSGGIRVNGAGKDAKTPAFWMDLYCSAKYIDNPHANGKPNAIILVTPRMPLSGGRVPVAFVHYDAGAAKWMLKSNNTVQGDGCTPVGVNVLVIAP